MLMGKRIGVRASIALASAIQVAGTAGFLARYWRWAGGEGSNVDLFFRYATRIMHGEIPYRQFEVEYPLLALPVLLIPRFFASTQFWYMVAFAAEMTVFNILTIVMVARRVERDEGADHVLGRLAWHTVFSGLMCPLLLVRYDLAPTLFGFAAASWWSSDRARSGGVAAGVGMVMKVFPGVCVMPALLREFANPRASRLRGTLAFMATVLVSLGVWLLIAGSAFFSAAKYHSARGIEIGSIYAGADMLLGLVSGNLPEVEFNYGAFHLKSARADRLVPLTFPIQLASLLAVLVMYRVSGWKDEIRYATAALLAFAIMGKVLSPQYLIWLIPFFAVLEGPIGRLARPLFALSCFATSLVYPVFFGRLLTLDPGGIILLNARNVLVLALLALLVFGDVLMPKKAINDDPTG